MSNSNSQSTRKRVFGFALSAMFFGFCASAQTQQAKRVPLIGSLSASAPFNPERIEAFRQGLRDLGYVEGKNIAVEYRWAEGKAERLFELAAELVSLKPDVLFIQSPQAVFAAKKATTKITIVFLGICDSFGIGLMGYISWLC